MPPPAPKYNVAQIWDKGKSQGVIQVEKKKMGRPTDNPKTVVKRARMSEEDIEKLKYCCKILLLSESDVLRMGIDEVYQKIKK